MLELLLIRHGETDWNVSQKVMGRQAVPINEAGRKQAGELARYLAGSGLRAIISSPVLRAVETSEILVKGHAGVEIETDERLAEIDYGDWINLTFTDILNGYGDHWKKYRTDPNDLALQGGESMNDAQKRVALLVRDVKKRFKDGRVALVSHADIIKIVLIEALGMDFSTLVRFSIDNCAMLLVRFTKDAGPRLVFYNPFKGLGRDM